MAESTSDKLLLRNIAPSVELYADTQESPVHTFKPPAEVVKVL